MKQLPGFAFALAAGAQFAIGEDVGFREQVWPLLEARCVKCHGTEKQKGDLRLDSREAALKGGENGPALEHYEAAVEGFRGARFAMWTEIDGTETEIPGSAATLTLTSNTLYSVRFRVTQASAGSTRLLGKVWDASQAEPSSFQIDIMDSTAQLQNLSGGVAVDSWSTATSGPISVGTQVDNIEVR